MNITLDHDCARGFTFRRKTVSGNPINCTGGSLKAEIRAEPDAPLLGSFTFVWLDAANGRFSMNIGKEVVNSIPDGTYRYDIIYTDSNGIPKKILKGTITKQGSITK